MTLAPSAGLIVAPSWVGDAVLAEPLIRLLKTRQPERELDVLAPAWVAPVFARMAGVRRVLDNPFAHGQLRLTDRYRLGRQLAQEKYTQAWVLPNSLKSALLPWFAGIPQRIGYTGEARYGLINQRHTLDAARLPRMVQRFAALARSPGEAPDAQVSAPCLSSSPAQGQATLHALQLAPPPRLAILCPGAEYGPAKRWPASHFATLARELETQGYGIWLLGSGKDQPDGEAIREQAPTVVNLCGRTRLDQAIDLLALADLVVCNDSGLMHVAAALGRPLIALFGSSSPGFTPPLSPLARVLRIELPCSPCFQRRCPHPESGNPPPYACLTGLTPATVLAAIQDISGQPPPNIPLPPPAPL